MPDFVVTVARSFGSGGRIIGKMLARKLDVDYYDSELIRLASEESGINLELFGKADERVKTNLFRRYNRSYGEYLIPPDSDEFVSDDNLFNYQAKIIRDLGQKKNCVIIGRCADYILRDHPRAVNVFVTGAPEDRVRRLCEQENVTHEDAEAQMERTDDRRASYYDYFSSGKWGEAATYHLCIDSSVLGIEGTADFIREFAERKLKMNLSGR